MPLLKRLPGIYFFPRQQVLSSRHRSSPPFHRQRAGERLGSGAGGGPVPRRPFCSWQSRGGSAWPQGATTHWQPMHSRQIVNGSLLWREGKGGKSPAGNIHSLPAISYPSRFSSFAVSRQEGALACPLPSQRFHTRSPALLFPPYFSCCMLKVIWKQKSWAI